MEPHLTLYDLAGATHSPFSPKTWQIRLALNYKQLPFKTVWLNMIDIKPTLQRLGASPTIRNAEPEGVYTVPVLVDASNPAGPPVVISHSLPIAEYLDKKYPERPLFPSGTKALLALFDDYVNEKIYLSFSTIIVPRTLAFLAERDRGYFLETRQRWLGCKLEDISPPGPKREGQWETLRERLDALAKLLNKNDDSGNLFVLGDQVSRADFVLIALFAWMANLVEAEEWERVMTWNGGRWRELWEASKDWRLNQA